MSSEKPTTRIITGVAVAVLGPLALYLCRKWLIPIGDWLWGVVVLVWNWIFVSHAVPGWLIILLSSIAGVALSYVSLRIWKLILNYSAPGTQWTEFTRFEFKGVLWGWRYYDGQISSLVSYCPKSGCEMLVDGVEDYDLHTEYKCVRCGHTERISGRKHFVEETVTREIDRLLRLGEWKKHVQQRSESV